MVYVLNYAEFKDKIVEALTANGLKGSVDEVIFLNTHSRGCEVLVHPWDEPDDVWAKVHFEWASINQALVEELSEDGMGDYVVESLGDLDAEVMMHVSYHLHFSDLMLAPDATRHVAEDMKGLAEQHFGEEGGVIAEVSMTSSESRLECLRFEVGTSAPMVTDEPWWEQFADVTGAMLEKMQMILFRLRSEYDSSPGRMND